MESPSTLGGVAWLLRCEDMLIIRPAFGDMAGKMRLMIGPDLHS
jgi:hypothetical protein